VLDYSEYIVMLVALRRLLFFAFLLAAVVLPAQRLLAAPRPMSSAPGPVPPAPAISLVNEIYLAPFNMYGPLKIAVDSGRNLAYAVLFYPNLLWVLDTSTGQLAYSLYTDGLLPTDVAVNPQSGLVYVTNQSSPFISVLDEGTKAWLAPINVGGPSQSMAIERKRNRAYVTTYGKTVLVLDLTNGSVLKTIHDRSFSTTNGVALDPRQSRAYVQNEGSTSISVINTITNRVIKSVDTGHASNAVAVDPVAQQLFVANSDGTLSVINTVDDADTLVATIDVSSAISDVVVNPALHRAYVTNLLENTVSEIDTQQNMVIGTIPVGLDPEGIAVDLTTNREYVASYYADYVTVLGE
jgi:YVTN family beta-propeller protein